MFDKVDAGLAFEVGDEGAELIEVVLLVVEGKEEFVDVVVEVFGKSDVDDLKILNIASSGAGD